MSLAGRYNIARFIYYFYYNYSGVTNKMKLKIRRYNVLAFEPEGIDSGLKIATGVLDKMNQKARIFREGLIPMLAEQKYIPGGMTLEDFAGISHEAPENIMSAFPEDELFFVPTSTYRLRGVPGTISALRDMYEFIGNEGVEVFLLNTASKLPSVRNDLEYIAKHAEKDMPLLKDATWVVTNSLREPMPKELSDLLLAKRDGRPNGASSRGFTKMYGLPYKVPLGESMVMSTISEAADVVYERLKYLRKDPTRYFGALKVKE